MCQLSHGYNYSRIIFKLDNDFLQQDLRERRLWIYCLHKPAWWVACFWVFCPNYVTRNIWLLLMIMQNTKLRFVEVILHRTCANKQFDKLNTQLECNFHPIYSKDVVYNLSKQKFVLLYLLLFGIYDFYFFSWIHPSCGPCMRLSPTSPPTELNLGHG